MEPRKDGVMRDEPERTARARGIHASGMWHDLERMARERGIDAMVMRPADRLPSPLRPPESFFPSGRSVVVAARSYRALDEEAVFDADPGPRGRIARYTRANGYDALAKALKRFLGDWRARGDGPSRWRISVNGPVLREKGMAVACGLGGLGRHGVVLLPRHGPHVLLAVAVTDRALPPGSDAFSMDASPSPCTGCGACVAACPTGALDGGRLNRALCIQALCTKPGPLPPAVERVWGDRLYGCSSCQDACPVGRQAPLLRPLPERGRLGASLPLALFLEGSDEEIRSRLRGNQMGARWVPVEALRRNAALCRVSESA